MDLSLLLLAVCGVALVIAALLRRRAEAHGHEQVRAERAQAVARGSHQARLQHPAIDLGQCIGCGACVRACPEQGVLELVYGQAVVVHGARCVGHGRCAEVCPTSAIALTLGDLRDRRDLPAIDERLEAVGTPGLFLAGEITGFALVRTAVAHGSNVARAVHQRLRERPSAARSDNSDSSQPQPVDLLVIGTGPAGMACLLAAKQLGLRAVGVDQAQQVGGTVASYPRKKLVMTQPMELPLHGRLPRLEYRREQLIELWQDLAERHELDIRLETVVQRVEHRDGALPTFAVDVGDDRLLAHNVCIAVGRRGTPRRLDVPGEQLDKVAYSLLDAAGYRDRRILVVGGGDSAVEAALALAEQPGNEVVLSYRRGGFSRLKAKNEQRIAAAFEDGLVVPRLATVVREITTDRVVLQPVGDEPDAHEGGVAVATESLANDDVFVFAGGTPPFGLLEQAGVSFDPSDRPAPTPGVERGTGLLVALLLTLVGLIALLTLRFVDADYYDLEPAARVASERHAALRPQGTVALLCGLLAAALFLANLCYLVRRSRVGTRLPGSLRKWMNAHVATGIGACLFAVLHSAFSLRDSTGGHALLAMIVVVVAGVVGRWFYAFLPRAQNGRVQHIEELGQRVAAIATEWDREGRGFGAEARRMVEQLVDEADIGKGLLQRVRGLIRGHWRLHRRLERFVVEAQRSGVPRSEVRRMVQLSKRSHRLAMQLAHYDDLRGLLSSWRWLHRWLALLLGALLVVHVVSAVRFGDVDIGGALVDLRDAVLGAPGAAR